MATVITQDKAGMASAVTRSLTKLIQYLLLHLLTALAVALDRYRGCRTILVEGGDHGLSTFADHVDTVIEFCGIARKA